MPVELEADGEYRSLRRSVTELLVERDALRAERDELLEQTAVQPDLYDELHANYDHIETLTETVQRYREALKAIVERSGRGGLNLAREALDSQD